MNIGCKLPLSFLFISIIFLICVGSSYAQENIAYAQVIYHNHAGVTLPFTSNVYKNLYFNETYHLKGFEYDNWNNLTTLYDGHYKACFTLIGTGLNNHLYRVYYFVNDVEKENCESEKQLAVGGDVVTMNSCCILELKENDKIGLKIADIGGSGDGTYIAGNMNLDLIDRSLTQAERERNIFLIFLVVSTIILILGYSINDYPIKMFGGFIITALGLYVFQSGLYGLEDPFSKSVVQIILLAAGVYVIVVVGYDWLQEGKW